MSLDDSAANGKAEPQAGHVRCRAGADELVENSRLLAVRNAATAIGNVDVLGPRAASLWNNRQPALAEDTSSRTSSDGEEGFIAVPYAPALASGELLRVVRTELYPAALVSLGVDIDPAWAGKMPAELLVGEDGYPRAVRVSADADYVF